MRLIIIITLLCVAVQAGAQESEYYRDLKKGWWWYENPPKEEPEKKETKPEKKARSLPSLKNYTREQLWNMHPDDFQALLLEFQKKAVMKLSEESVAEYLEMQEIASKKSLGFANVAAYVRQKKPELAVPEYSLAAPGMVASTRMRSNDVETRIRKARNDYALIYFYSPECEYCRAQDGILKYFQNKYGWELRAYQITSPLASRLNVTTTPTIILIYRNSRDYFPVSAGVVSLADIEQRLYRGIMTLSGENSPRNFSLYEHEKGGSYDIDHAGFSGETPSEGEGQ